MGPTDRNPTTFDVVPLGELRWAVRGPAGRTICTYHDEEAAIEFASIAAMGKLPAKVRLLTAEGTIRQEWDYPA